MATIASPTSATAQRIFAAWEKRGTAEQARTYLGASIAGHECDMYLWLNFRGIVHEFFPGRMYRLFNRGQREEAVFIEDLKSIGCEVVDRDPNTHNQIAVSWLGGHASGHLDSVVRGIPECPTQWCVAEFKTHSSDSFKKLAKEGVRKAKPMHFTQMQLYMGGMHFSHALYLAVNKDNDDLYAEVVKFDETFYNDTLARMKHIIDTCQPERCAKRADDYRCKMCACKNICWHTAPQIVDPSVPFTCRTCCHSTANTEKEGAQWECRLGNPCGAHNQACADYLIIPTLVNADVVDATDNTITYKAGEEVFTLGPKNISTKEISKVNKDGIAKLLAIRNKLGAVIVSANTIEMQTKGMHTYYSGTIEGLRGYMQGFAPCNFAKPQREEVIEGTQWILFDNELICAVNKQNDTGILYGGNVEF